MNTLTAIGLALVAMLTTGCVAQSRYTAALTESEALKAELAGTQVDIQSLERQAGTLQEQNQQLTSKLQTSSAERHRLQSRLDKQRAQGEAKLKKLQKALSSRRAQQKRFRQDADVLKQRNAALQALVARYEKELKDVQTAVAPPFPKPAAQATMQQMPPRPSQMVPGASIQPPAGPSGPVERPPVAGADKSWWGMITGWLASLWDALFGD